MQRISLHDIRVHAYHGCLEEEAIIGTQYTVKVDLFTDFMQAAEEDDLSKTIDYVRVSEIVHEQMAIRSKLIETVALRIVNALRSEFPSALEGLVTVEKHAAPMPGQVGSVSVEMGW
ncbi:MAG: dihydroneopterin aldolase [Flavobacteriales bacterium]|jgi:dihydroneopterin aldolase